MADTFDDVLDRFRRATKGFEHHLRAVPPGGWGAPTPCPEWDVRQLANHMTRGNLNYVGLVRGATGAEFLAQRDADALGDDPVTAFTASAEACADAFAGSGALDRVVDYPMGKLTGRRALAVRTADSVVHTWDLARARGRRHARRGPRRLGRRRLRRHLRRARGRPVLRGPAGRRAPGVTPGPAAHAVRPRPPLTGQPSRSASSVRA
ncbi:TIGR03086 family metal-binding protein [Amycolatopsis sp. NBC_00348]|uniref:TIGR03086 family metal-binding protein n=1 Tax=Amycolatopsis sp. NBC_00348 TaxID=2975956 RepID=UPI002E271B7B